MEDPRLVAAASAEFVRVVRDLPQDAWSRPTPSEMTVRDLVEHVVFGNLFTGLLLEGVDRVEARSRLAGDLLAPDPLTAVVESAQRQAEAFAAAEPDQPVPHTRGPVPATLFLCFRLVDLVVHAWDLRRAADLEESLDPVVVSAVWSVVEPRLDEMLAFDAYGEGPSGTLPTDASPQAVLLDAFGRRP